MLTLDADLPEHLLLPDDTAAYDLSRDGAIWFDLSKDRLSLDADTGHICGISARLGDVRAAPTQPNDGNSFPDAGGAGLVFQNRVHCGFCFRLDRKSQSASWLIRYRRANGEARTLATLTGDAEDVPYIFLSEQNGTIQFKPDNNETGIVLPIDAEPGEWVDVWAGIDPEGLSLAMGSDPAATDKRQARYGFSLPAEFFVGCRSHRAGLLKTLGEKTISDIIIWPDFNILHQASSLQRDRVHRVLNSIRKRKP